MNPAPRSARLALSCLLAILPATAFAQLTGYWPLDSVSGGTTANLAPGANPANVFGGVTVVPDATRNNNVFEFNGAGGYVDAGSIPAVGLNTAYTWSFWADSLNNGDGNPTIVGNRYDPNGNEFSPREFTKFTPTKFEFHHDGFGENSDYADLVLGEWHYHTIVKDGNSLIYMRDGVVTGVSRITGGMLSPHPLYFGGNAASESWNGRLDDVATWNNAVPLSSISAIARGTATPLTAPATFTPSVVLSDNFNSPTLNTAKWTATHRGLENNAAVGYAGPNIVNGGVGGSTALQLGGTTTNSYWYGDSIESNQLLDGSKEALITVQRMSLAVSGSAGRSSLWVLGDDAHYLHFSQNIGEGGWSWNSRDDGGVGSLSPVGAGNNIGLLDGLDNDLGQHKMGLRVASAGAPGDYNILMYLDDQVVASQFVSNWPDTYKVILTGQARQSGDSAVATFDDLQVVQAPEPATGALMLVSVALLARRRRGR
jgi:hypothetical protein